MLQAHQLPNIHVVDIHEEADLAWEAYHAFKGRLSQKEQAKRDQCKTYYNMLATSVNARLQRQFIVTIK